MIHETSVISKKAFIDPSSFIGPFCTIGDNVKIGKNNKLISHVSITGNTNIGNENVFYPFCSIGSEPQDLKFKGEKSFLIIGNKNIFRENVTVNPGTIGGGLKTTINNNCLFMVGSHIAHDCLIESNVILANNATLAGHVQVHENAILGGNSAVHQYVKIGKYAMIGGMSGVEKNIIPYGLYTGIRSDLKGINIVGLKRKGLNSTTINNILKCIKIIFSNADSIDINVKNIPSEYLNITEIQEITEYIINFQKRGLCRYKID